MGSECEKELPVIDFSVAGLTPGSLVWKSVKSQVHEALVEYGCFEACFDKVDLEQRNSTIEAVKEAFDLPSQTKNKTSAKSPYGGYIAHLPGLPLFESIGVENPNVLQNVQAYSGLLWPEGNSTFCKAIHSFSKKASELDEMVRIMVLESLGVEKYMDEHMNSTDYLFRVMKYKAPETTDKMPGLKCHTDKDMVTVLYQDQTGGLEIQTRDGDWIYAKPASFIVFIGDFLHAWTNGRLHSAYHQVNMRGNEDRYSIGLFSVAKSGYIIKAPEEFIDEEYPLLFKPFEQDEFYSYYFSEAGRKADSGTALAAFCGVN